MRPATKGERMLAMQKHGASLAVTTIISFASGALFILFCRDMADILDYD
jgi:hypothetical protein